eukprot:XP_011603488.1 PREDICTED: GON-4-like protein [Takifugu rubripes]
MSAANGHGSIFKQMVRRRPANKDVCPLELKSLRTEEDTGLFSLDEESATKSSPQDKWKEEETPDSGGQMAVSKEKDESFEDELGRLDMDLVRKSKQHNLTSNNVRAILHEVITHEHVVSMMKAAIRDTQDQPMFEPKMTRSRLKQAAPYSQLPNWSLSANTVKHPQFVDIDLDDDEDSSDEEYCPDEEEDDDEEEEDTAEESFHSDVDIMASLPRKHQGSLSYLGENPTPVESLQSRPQDQTLSFSAPQHLLVAPESSFLDRLNAVDEELNCSSTYAYNQSLDKKAANDDAGVEDTGCLAYRTRSKLPLVNIPLGQLEAELLAPDITADMYEQSAAQREEDRHWAEWLQSLMDPENLEEADDDDDPEYNFVDDLDKPDKEDYRTDRAVQITRKEVNELLDELFDTLQDEKQEEAPSQAGSNFNTPQALCFGTPLAEMLTKQRQTIRKQYETLQQRRALQDMTNHDHCKASLKAGSEVNAITPVPVTPCQEAPPLHLNTAQKLQLQQQLQQHVQLLTQVHLLCRNRDNLMHEACMSKQYLEELIQFSRPEEELGHPSSFRVCNLQAALNLLQEVEQRAAPSTVSRAPASYKGWLPRMTAATNSHAFPLLPVEDAWLFATRSVFLYPEILPVCSLDKKQNHRVIYTPGENGLIVLALKHFEGTLDTDQLISSYLLCKSRWSIRKHIKEMSTPKVSPDNVIKTFIMKGIVRPLPLACSRVQPGDQRPPVDRITANVPKWLKNSQLNIQKTRLSTNSYPHSLPPGCSLRLHPHFVSKARPPSLSHRRIFTLAHNASLLPLAKAPAERQVHCQPVRHQPVRPEAAGNMGSSKLPTHHCYSDTNPSDFSTEQEIEQDNSRKQNYDSGPHLPTQTSCNCSNPLTPCIETSGKARSFLLPMMWTPSTLPTPSCAITIQQDPGQQIQSLLSEGQKCTGPCHLERTESSRSPSPLSPRSVEQEGKPEVQQNQTTVEFISLNGGETTSRQEQGGSGGECTEGGGEEEPEGGEEREDGKRGGEEERENGGGEGEEDGEKDKNEDQDKDDDQEDEEEEDFDDLTQDEDDEEVMSTASEESVLSVPELQETMKQLTWLAAEQRHCTDGDSEEEHSPISPGSQEEEEEDDEEGPKGQEEEVEEERSSKEAREGMLSAEGTPQGVGRCSGRGRGRGRPLRGLRRSRQERHSKDATKLLLLYDDNILDNDPFRESKDVAFAQNYLSRVREALQDDPVQVENFVSLLHDFEQLGQGQEVMPLFRKLRSILGDQSDLLRDFAAFLYPEQALQCGLFEEQQAFERSRRFLRQLEISFGDNPSHYQKIIKALTTSPDLNPSGIDELKAQMAILLKGHTHLQAEFWVFFEELHPPTAHPGQFEESHWPESGDSQVCRGEAAGGFEEVSLPDLEEEAEGYKIQPMTSRRQRRKLGAHKNYKDYEWSPKDWPCHCGDARLRRKRCARCHGNKTSGGVSRAMKSLDPAYSHLNTGHSETGEKDQDVKRDSLHAEQRSASWESVVLTDEKEEEEMEKEEDEEERKKRTCLLGTHSTITQTAFPSSSFCLPVSSPRPPPDLPVCAKNISLTANGEKVILWTREADRVILTRCQQDGANQNTFQAISTLLGNKTPNEVFCRFQDLMGLFRTAARQTSSEEDAPPAQLTAAEDEDD